MPAKLTQEQFIALANQVHHGKYNYNQTCYTLSTKKVSIICPTHGLFDQRAANHLLGRGCPGCQADKTSARCRSNTADFILKARATHGDIYDYSRVAYERSNKKVEILCKRHGPFLVTPNSHLCGTGCPTCAGKGLSDEDLIDVFRDIHGDLYDYSLVRYSGIKDPIKIVCEKHGVFEQTPDGHKAGHGCLKCWHESYASSGEAELADWIESQGITVQRNVRDIVDGFEVDILLPDQGLGVEFNGRYWHSDRVIKNHRQQEYKQKVFADAGVRLLTVWDFDWATKPNIIKRHILHAVGLSLATAYHARKCTIEVVPATAARAFYDQHHIQGACRGSIVNLGLSFKGELVACMSFGRGASRRGKSEDWELLRYATKGVVRGGASRLFADFVRQTAPQKIWSFSDNQSFGGGMYQMLGFVVDGEVKADYRVVHTNKGMVWHKSLWQRRHIPKRIKELGRDIVFDPKSDPRTERQMQDALGVLRVWDSGKTRWLWATKYPGSPSQSRQPCA